MDLDFRGLHPDAVEDFMLSTDRIRRESDARRAESGDPGIQVLIGFDPIGGRVIIKRVAAPPPEG